MEKIFKDRIKVNYIESVPEGSEAIGVLKTLASRGYNLIYTTSFSYMQQTAQVAIPKRHIRELFRLPNVSQHG